MNTNEILKCGLIGLNAEVVESKNKKMIGIKGKIIDETMNTIQINDKMIMKKDTTFRIEKEDYVFDVDGNLLVGRVEDKLKKARLI